MRIFCSGFDARVDGRPPCGLAQLLERQAPELGTVHHVLALAEDPQAPRDRPRGDGVVARDHHRLDSGRNAFRHCRRGLLARRIEQSDEPEQHQVGLHLFLLARRQLWPGANRYREHAQPFRGHGLGHRQHGLRFDRSRVVRAGHAAATGQHRFGCALGERGVGLPVAVERGHALAFRVERQLHDARILRREQRLVGSAFPRQLVEGGLGGVPLQLSIGADLRIVRKRHRAQQLGPRRPLRRRRWGLDELPGRPHPRHLHAVLRERSGLVRADDGDRAQRLHRRQPAHERVALRHLPGPHGQRHGHDRRQRLGNRGHREAHRREEHERQGLPAQQAGDEHDRADAECRERQALAEVRQAPLQRGLALGGGLEELGDAAQFRGHAGCRGDSAPATVGDHGALVGHVGAIAESGVAGGDGRDLLVHRERLAGERGLLDLQAHRFDQAQVRRHDVARLEEHEIAGHQFAGRDVRDLAVADDARVRRAEPAQRGHGAFGPVLLDEADHRVQDHDDHDRDGVLRLAHHPGNHRRHQQHDDHEVGELARQHQPRRAAFALGQLVGAVHLEPLPGFAVREPRARLRAQVRGHFRGLEAVPVGTGFGRIDPRFHGAAPRSRTRAARGGRRGCSTCPAAPWPWGRCRRPGPRRAARATTGRRCRCRSPSCRQRTTTCRPRRPAVHHGRRGNDGEGERPRTAPMTAPVRSSPATRWPIPERVSESPRTAIASLCVPIASAR